MRAVKRGATLSVNIFSISRGTPGKKNACAPPSEIWNPGAMPAALASACAPTGMRTWRRLLGVSSNPWVANRFFIASSDG